MGGCPEAIDKAASFLLDQGRIGLSLALDSSSYATSTAIPDPSDGLRKGKMLWLRCHHTVRLKSVH